MAKAKMSECSIRDVKNKVLQMLARREHTRHELVTKLGQRDYPSSMIESVLDELQNDGLLCDERAAEMYIRQRSNKGYGEMKIRAELMHKGVDRDCINQCFVEAELDWHEIGAKGF